MCELLEGVTENSCSLPCTLPPDVDKWWGARFAATTGNQVVGQADYSSKCQRPNCDDPGTNDTRAFADLQLILGERWYA
jgi:hypothetical protein